MIPTVYQSFNEKLTKLPLTSKSPYKCYTYYELTIPTLSVGDVLQVSACGEVTNNLGYNVMFCHYACLYVDKKEIIITAKRGKNVTQAEHHWDWTDCGVYVSKIATKNAKLRIVAYGASTSYKSGHTLLVEQNQGQLSCLVFTT